MDTDNLRLLLTPKEAATALGLGRSKIYELIRAGDLPSVQIGRCRRIPVDRYRGLPSGFAGVTLWVNDSRLDRGSRLGPSSDS